MRITEDQYQEILQRPGVRNQGQEKKNPDPGPKPRKRPSQQEYEEQKKLFIMAGQAAVKHPELRLLNGSLNGVRLNIGQAMKAKKAGMKAGYPDVFLPVSRQGHAGLYIEMKIKGNSPSVEQKWWLRRLKEEGYCCCICYSASEAWDAIKTYLQGGKNHDREQQGRR